MDNYEAFGAERIKHLELCQGVITRLSNAGFFVKGWSVTVTGALLGLAVNSNSPGLALVIFGPTVAFWVLDTSFLRSERLFRELYSEVCQGGDQVRPFFMAATSPSFIKVISEGGNARLGSWWWTAVRPTLWVFYVALLTAAVLGAILICKT